MNETIEKQITDGLELISHIRSIQLPYGLQSYDLSGSQIEELIDLMEGVKLYRLEIESLTKSYEAALKREDEWKEILKAKTTSA